MTSIRRDVRLRLRLLAALAGAVLLVGCGSGDDEATDAGLPNPASVYCEAQGGHVEDEQTEGGVRGVCVLPDGRRVDEWELYRARGATTTIVASDCSASGLPPDVEDDPSLPSAVATMRADLARAAATCDYDALAELVDRHGRAVRFSWGDEVDPIAFWQAAEALGDDPAPLRALRTLLDLPAARSLGGDGNVQYVWPAAFATEHPTDPRLREIAETGLYELPTLRGWVASGTNYLGYRVLVTEAGDWTGFVAGD